jgi:hypothetical protein
VAIAAIDAVVAHVVLMTELNRLFTIDICPGNPRGPIYLAEGPAPNQQECNHREDA